jgi:hypothetical protein
LESTTRTQDRFAHEKRLLRTRHLTSSRRNTERKKTKFKKKKKKTKTKNKKQNQICDFCVASDKEDKKKVA